MQLKCTERGVTTKWDINKRFFRPSTLRDASFMISNSSAAFLGSGGGVLLIEYSIGKNNEVELKYFYSDFVFLSIFQRSVKKWPLKRNFVEFVSNIFHDGNTKFSLPKSLFIEVSVVQFLHLSRNLPVSSSVQNNNLWTFRYTHLEAGQVSKSIPEERLVKMGSPTQSKLFEIPIRIRPIFDYGLRDIPVNDVMIIR